VKRRLRTEGSLPRAADGDGRTHRTTGRQAREARHNRRSVLLADRSAFVPICGSSVGPTVVSVRAFGAPRPSADRQSWRVPGRLRIYVR
jgi:hypothetical protein